MDIARHAEGARHGRVRLHRRARGVRRALAAIVATLLIPDPQGVVPDPQGTPSRAAGPSTSASGSAASFAALGRTWPWVPAAQARSRRERNDRNDRNDRDDDSRSSSGSSSGGSGSSGSGSSGSGSSGSGGASPAAASTSGSAPASAIAAPAAQRAGDSNDRFGRETAAGAAEPARDTAGDRSAVGRTPLPDEIRNAAASRAGRRDGERGERGHAVSRDVLALRPSPQALDRAARLGLDVRRGRGGASKLARLTVPDGLSVVSMFDKLSREMPGERFGLNHAYRSFRAANTGSSVGRSQSATTQPCPPDRCFGAQMIRWRSPLARCSQGVRIGVIDTSVDFSHPAFGTKRFVTRSFAAKPVASDASPHGTGILALLAAQERGGTPGLIPSSEFYVADVFSADAHGQPIADTASLIEALDWMQENKVRIVNASVAGPSDALLAEKIRELAANGILVVAAAGNDGVGAPPSYPAAYPEVIAVTAVDRNLRGYRQANHGDYIDVAAPGVEIWTAVPNRREGYQTGTSFAVPYVTAMAATLLLPGEPAHKPDILKRLQLVDLGQPGRDAIYGLGAPVSPTTCGSRAIASTAGWSTHVMRALPKAPTRTNFSLAGSD